MIESDSLVSISQHSFQSDLTRRMKLNISVTQTRFWLVDVMCWKVAPDADGLNVAAGVSVIS